MFVIVFKVSDIHISLVVRVAIVFREIVTTPQDG
jgi:hypothetical protein